MSRLTVLSLFTGIGGIDLAFQRAGFEVIGQIENDEFCNRVLAKHWPRVPRWGDIRDVTGGHIRAKIGTRTIDVMAGGFPCQDISVAGRGDGIQHGNRSGLWFEFARLIGDLRPRVVFLENVPAITTRGGTLVIADLAALGYDAKWGMFRASDVGAPHQRERWFCVAHAENARSPTPRTRGRRTEAKITKPARASDILANAQYRRRKGRKSTRNRTTSFDPSSSANRRRIAQSVMGRAINGFSNRLDGYQWPARPDEPQHAWEPPRVTTEKIPDRPARIKALGNAVVPQVIEPFAQAIRQHLEEIGATV